MNILKKPVIFARWVLRVLSKPLVFFRTGITPWYIVVVYSIIGGLFAFICIWALSLIPEGAASLEVINTKDAQTWQEIINNPLYLPHKLFSFFLLLFSDSVRVLRAVSVSVFILSAVSLFSLIKRWHSTRVALLTIVLFATNATVLSISRLGDPLVLLFCWSIFISLMLWVFHGNSKHIAPVLLAISGIMLLYVPGAPYVFVVLVALFFNRIKDFFQKISLRSTIIASVLLAIFISPLVYAFVQNSSLLLDWALLPNNIVISDIPMNLLAIPSSFFYQYQEADPLIAVAKLPILDLTSGILLLLGCYNYYKNRSLERGKVILLGALLIILLGALGQVRLGIALFLPFAFMLIAGGITYLLDIWYSVFPKNPFARIFAFVVIAIVVSAGSYFQLKKFFVVWPNSPETIEVYNQSRLIQ